MTTAHDEHTPAPVPARRSAGVTARPHEPERPSARRFPVDPRYPAMFHVAGGRLVWDGTRLHLVGPAGTAATTAPPAGRVTVTVGESVVVHLHPAQPATGASASAPATTRAVVLDRSAERFVRFARALHAAHPDAVTLDDRTAPSPRTPRLRPAARGSSARPGVFARALRHVRAASGLAPDPATGPADLVGALERLAALHRAGDLTAAEFDRAKARLLR